MNKKGIFDLSFILMVSIAVILIGYFTIPLVYHSTNPTSTTDTLNKNNASANMTFTLSQSPVSGTFSISGLTVTTNYTQTDKTIVINDKTGANNYTASYQYLASDYISTSGDRTLFNLIATLCIIGVIYLIARFMGLA